MAAARRSGYGFFMESQLPLTRDLVLLGGGHAHALVLRRWAMNPLPGVRLTLIEPNVKAPYTGMLPGHVAGHYGRGDLEIDIVRLAQFAGARLIMDRANGLDRAARLVMLEGRLPVAYDHLSIDIGITSAASEIEGFDDFAIAAKPLGPYAEIWEDFVVAVARGAKPPQVAVVGGGVGAVELALAMHHRLTGVTDKRPEIDVLEASRALQGTAPGTRRALLREMARAGISLTENARIARITGHGVEMADGGLRAAALVVGVAGARPWGWLEATDLPLENGFIKVDDGLRVTDDPAIHAAGDCAHLSHAPRPKAGVYAVRAAPVLFHNLRADLSGGRRRAYRPQRDFLKLVSLGRKAAVADKGGIGLQLPGLWYWKDWIDRRFMQKFHDLPAMPAPDLPREMAEGVRAEMSAHPIICGGCGAKVGPGALMGLINELAPPERADVLSRPGDDAGVLRIGGQIQVLSTDHLRAFVEDHWQMARITAIHALGDVWAMGAEPQAALVNIVLPRMSEPLQRRTLREIMDGAGGVMTEAGAAIIGGHSTQGSELTIGFTVTGLSEDRAIGLDGARPGDRLILTKPLGTGAIMAAAMRAEVDGDVVRAAIGSMSRSLAGDARALRMARAMTDVTGFGLAGHLLAICRASSQGAEIDLDAVPLLPGAEQLFEQGVRSSLDAANAAYAQPAIDCVGDAPAWLFDPQTAGGLLAAVPEECVDVCLAVLGEEGVAASVIGRITEGPPRITLL